MRQQCLESMPHWLIPYSISRTVCRHGCLPVPRKRGPVTLVVEAQPGRGEELLSENKCCITDIHLM